MMPSVERTAPKTIASKIAGSRRVSLAEQSWTVPTADGHRLSVLRRFPIGDVRPVPIVLIHGLAQNRLTWHLPQRSFQNCLVDAGFDTYNVELRGHSTSRDAGSPYPSSFEEYHELDVPAVVEAIAATTGATRCLIIGHSLGGSVSYAFGVRHPDRVAGIVSIGGPTHFSKGNATNRLVGAAVDTLYRRVPPWPWVLRQIPYAFGDLLGPFVVANRWYFDNPKFTCPLAVWLPGSMEPDVTRLRMIDGWDRTGMPVFMTMMRWFGSPDGNESDDGTINYSDELRDLTVPTLFVVGNRDQVAPRSSIEPGFDVCGAVDKTLVELGGGTDPDFGHIDLISGRHAPQVTWPVMRRWLEAHAQSAS